MQAFARSILPVFNVLGYVLLIFAGTMLVPLGVAFVFGEAAQKDYDIALVITAAAGAALLLTTRRYRRELLPRDGFLLVTLCWTVLPAFAALPLMLHIHGLSFTDAYFEAMSGMTTTGATVLSGLDQLPLSINVWRHFLVWLGGLGILVLAFAILPLAEPVTFMLLLALGAHQLARRSVIIRRLAVIEGAGAFVAAYEFVHSVISPVPR